MIPQEKVREANKIVMKYLDEEAIKSKGCLIPLYKEQLLFAIGKLVNIATLYSEGKIKEVLSDNELRKLLPKKISTTDHFYWLSEEIKRFNQAIDLTFKALQGKVHKYTEEELGKLADSVMYDFPRSYSNGQIQAFQKGIDKLWVACKKALLKERR